MNISADVLRNGLEIKDDLVLPEQPTHPEMRESTSIWMFNETGAFGFPRMGIEAEATSWDNRLYQANFAFKDGRVLNGAGRGAAPSPKGPDGRPTVLGAGNIVFRCIEPFRRWTMTFDGPAIDSHVSNQIANTVDPQKLTNVKLDAELTMVTPAWFQKSELTDESPEAAYMGLGVRFEHLFRAQGSFHVDGKTHAFKATGLRIKRQSIRRLEGFNGHCWQSAVFPDGRAFGYCAYPPKPDGSESYNDGYVVQDGRIYAAKAVNIPWLRRVVGRGDNIAVELDSELGRTRIEGTTELSTFRMNNPDMGGMPLNLQQSGAHYTWDGQSAYGMIERSSHRDLCTIA